MKGLKGVPNPAKALNLDVKQALALSSLEEVGVLLRDIHVDYGNGFHGTSYINPHALLERAAVILRLAQDLLEVLELGSVIKREIQVVSGPVTGGAQLALIMAAFLDGWAGKKKGPIFHAPIHRVNGGFLIRDHYKKVLKGRRVLLADDVRHTGATFVQCHKLITDCGGEVIATTELYDRMSVLMELPVPNIALAQYRLEQDLVPANDCVQCKLKVPITRF